ncbi:MAG: VCBS repeat-containing protein [Pyrinomonadaceae bacterium]|nr:VCBS repeat-containing protein [Pyrinomonadaceae bacterium]
MSIFKTTMLMMLAVWVLSVAFEARSSRRHLTEEVHPVLVDNCLIGGTINGKWMDAAAIAPKLKGGEKYRFYTLTARAGESTGAQPKPLAEYCSETMEVELSPKPTEGVALAVGGEWNAMPRAPRVLGNNEQAYRAVADILRRKRFSRPRINITQVLRVDLDGDSIEEVLVSASYLKDGLVSATGPMAIRPKAGDYSVVFLRKIIRGWVQNIIIDGEFYPRINEDTGPPSQYAISAVGDVDGDGTMEVVVRSDYYEGGGSTVYSIRRNKVEAMTSCACGA